MIDTNELKSEIIRNGYTVRSLARPMGLCEKTWYAKVNGKIAFDTKEISHLCELLHITNPVRMASIFLPSISQ